MFFSIPNPKAILYEILHYKCLSGLFHTGSLYPILFSLVTTRVAGTSLSILRISRQAYISGVMPNDLYQALMPPGTSATVAERDDRGRLHRFITEFERLEIEYLESPNQRIDIPHEMYKAPFPMTVDDAFLILFAVGWRQEHFDSFQRQLYALNSLGDMFAEYGGDYAEYAKDNIDEVMELRWQVGLARAAAATPLYHPACMGYYDIRMAALPTAVLTVVYDLRVRDAKDSAWKSRIELATWGLSAALEQERELSHKKDEDLAIALESLAEADRNSSETLRESSAPSIATLTTTATDAATQTSMSSFSSSAAEREDETSSPVDKATDVWFLVADDAADAANPERARRHQSYDAARGAVLVAKKQLACK